MKKHTLKLYYTIKGRPYFNYNNKRYHIDEFMRNEDGTAYLSLTAWHGLKISINDDDDNITLMEVKYED